MTNVVDHPQFDPEIEALLREIAADPRSNLLRVPRQKAARALVEDVPIVGVATAGLTKAERQLAIVHRHELSYLLRCAAWKRLTEGEDTWFVVSRSLPDGTEVPVPTLDSVRSEARTLIDAPPPDVSHLGALELLDRCVSSPFEEWPTVQQFAGASLRIAPSGMARVNAAAAILELGQPRSALLCLELAESSLPDDLSRSSLWSTRSRALFASGEKRDGLRALECAIAFVPCHPGLMIDRFMLALVSTNVEFARVALLAMAESAREPQLERECNRLRTRIDRSEWALDEQCFETARRLLSSAPLPGQKVIDVVLC